MQHVYHWKHGWIPLDHIAALSKAKGSHKAAAKMLRDVADNHHVLTRDQHAQALRGLSSIESPADRAAALKSALARADAAGHGDVAPASLRRSAGTRERLRGDLKTAQTAQQARAEEQGKGYKSETAAFYGSSKHATAAHSETKLTQSHADREATARAAADREEARAYAERKKAGHIADDLERLDGVHAPDAHAATQAALEARTLASVRAKGMKPADVDATLQAAMRLPESPQQQALVAALATHLTELKSAPPARYTPPNPGGAGPQNGYMSQGEKNRISAEYDRQVAAGTPGYHPTTPTASKSSTPSTAAEWRAAASSQTESARLSAAADAKRAEAQRIFDSTGVPERAAARLNAHNLTQAHKGTDSALRRYTAAMDEAERLDGKASLARSREAKAKQVGLTHAELVGAKIVVDHRGTPHEVVRVNAKSVTVKTPYSWTDTIPHHKIAKAVK